jgi:hypothetical protein
LAVVESIVGHSNPSMTRHYTHIGELAAGRAVAALPSIIGNAKPPQLKPPQSETLHEIQRVVASISAKNWRAKKAVLREMLSKVSALHDGAKVYTDYYGIEPKPGQTYNRTVHPVILKHPVTGLIECSWAPSYRVDISNPKSLSIEMATVIRNEVLMVTTTTKADRIAAGAPPPPRMPLVRLSS